jgi:uncharacterized phiE125 gp8 family phage protein
MQLTRALAPPVIEPVTLDEAKRYLRVGHDYDDGVILDLIAAAREEIVSHTSHAAGLQTWVTHASSWRDLTLSDGATIVLLPAPVTHVHSISIRQNGEQQTLLPSAYRVVLSTQPGRIVPVAPWPTVDDAPDAIEIVHDAGYATADEMPARMRQAVLMLIEQHYVERGGIWPAPPYALQRTLMELSWMVYR